MTIEWFVKAAGLLRMQRAACCRTHACIPVNDLRACAIIRRCQYRCSLMRLCSPDAGIQCVRASFTECMHVQENIFHSLLVPIHRGQAFFFTDTGYIGLSRFYPQ